MIKLKDILNEMLNETDTHDVLLDYDTATDWAIKNVDGVEEAFNSEEENPDDIHASYFADNYRELIDTYVDFYNDVKRRGHVELFRAIRLKSFDELDLKDIGMHWSFEYSSAGVYGSPTHDKFSHTGDVYVIGAEVEFGDIEWLYSFTSFLHYGEDQSECSLKKGTTLEITSVNKKELQVPLQATVGNI